MIERERIGQKKREPKANNILLSPVLTNTFMIINFSSIGNPLSSSFDLSSLSCPCCRARGLMTYHSSYRRFFVSVDQPDTPLFVPIVYCPSCHSFHVVLPHSACPFSSFSYGFIFEVLLQYCSGPYPGNKSRTAALFAFPGPLCAVGSIATSLCFSTPISFCATSTSIPIRSCFVFVPVPPLFSRRFFDSTIVLSFASRSFERRFFLRLFSSILNHSSIVSSFFLRYSGLEEGS